MKSRVTRLVMTVLGLSAIVSMPAATQAADPDWKAVEQALGKSGQLQPGDVFRVGMPRTDLNVTVKGVPVRPGFALGSYAAFKQVGDHAMVMGDLVLLDAEVPAVMSGLFAGGLEVTAVHNHLNEMSPHVMYMHYEGRGDAVQLAKGLHTALSASATPLARGPSPAAGVADRDRADDRLEADRASSRSSGERHRRRRVPDHGTPRGGHHRDGASAAAGDGRRDGDELPAER